MERSLVMGLGVIEITEEDCHTAESLKTRIISKDHAETLIGKYYKLDLKTDWTELKKEDVSTLKVGQRIYLRSPIFCQTPKMKICQMCWGTKKSPTKYLGVLAGEVLSERLTQLTMRSFHDSGSANLDVSPILVDFITDHLIDIKTEQQYNILTFNTEPTEDIVELFKKYKEFVYVECVDKCVDENKSTNVIFINRLEPKHNQDPIRTMRVIKELLKTQKKDIEKPHKYYKKAMESLLTVGKPYSSFIECLFANMFVTKKKLLWRYNQDQPIIEKLGYKTLTKQVSPLLNLLYQQNKNSINNIDDLEIYDKYEKDDQDLTVHELMFLEKF